jgi:hypothetical protein
MTQMQKVLKHLEAGKSITQGTANLVYGISRLSSVIEDIRRSGVEVDMVLKRDEVGKQYGEYKLRSPIKLGSEVQVKAGHGIGLPSWVRFTRGATVVGQTSDSVLVNFIRGKNTANHWMLEKELVNAN